MAIICKEAAKAFIKADNNFEIVNTLVQNSDIFLTKKDNIKKIGTSQNRNYQNDLVKEYYKDSKSVSFINSSLPYALESNKVDAIVIDAIKALSMQGKKQSTSVIKDYDTYVLVVSKVFKNSDSYRVFKNVYNKSVLDLKDKNNFKKQLQSYTDKNISKEDMGEFEKWKLKFLPIEN